MRSLRLLPVLGIALACAAARAEEAVDPFELSPEQLFAAEVTSATRTGDTWWNTPAAVFVLTGEDIRRSGATSIPEALRGIPGLDVARFNTASWAVSARGFESQLANKLLVLIDGREVYNSLFSGVYWDAQDTVLEDIDRIEVIRGPGATVWGSNAVNGVINVITKSARETQGGLVSSLAGNEEMGTSARWGGRLGAGGHYRVFGKGLKREDQRRIGGGNAEDEWSAGRGGFRADWGGDGAKNVVTLQGDGYYGVADQWTAVPSLGAPYANVGEDPVKSRGGNVLGRWRRELPGRSRLTTQLYVDYERRELSLLEDEVVAFDLDVQWELPRWMRNQVTIGGRYRHTIDTITPSPRAFLEDRTRHADLVSAFVQDEIEIVPERLVAILGSKFERDAYTGLEIQPGARLQWHPDRDDVVWASVARAVRTPSRLERDLGIDLAVLPPVPALPVPILLALEGNEDFESEKLVAYELGWRRRFGDALFFDVAAFHNDYDDLATNTLLPPALGFDPLHLVLPFDVENTTRAKTWGVEALATWRALDRLRFTASYTFLNMELDGPPPEIAIDAEAAENQSPSHQFHVGSQLDLGRGVELDTNLYFAGGVPAHDLGSVWRLDVRLAWQVRPGLELGIVGQNLLREATREFGPPTDVNLSEIERSVFGVVRWRF
jgi:iron complex outermembrane receptor protein